MFLTLLRTRVLSYARSVVGAISGLLADETSERALALTFLEAVATHAFSQPRLVRDGALRFAIERVRSYLQNGIVQCPHLVANGDGNCTTCSEPVTVRAHARVDDVLAKRRSRVTSLANPNTANGTMVLSAAELHEIDRWTKQLEDVMRSDGAR